MHVTYWTTPATKSTFTTVISPSRNLAKRPVADLGRALEGATERTPWTSAGRVLDECWTVLDECWTVLTFLTIQPRRNTSRERTATTTSLRLRLPYNCQWAVSTLGQFAERVEARWDTLGDPRAFPSGVTGVNCFS
jgi:hypothetical protein